MHTRRLSQRRLLQCVRCLTTHEEPRINPVGIQHLSKSLHEQLFGNKKLSKKEDGLSPQEKSELVQLSKQFLKQHGLLGKKTSITSPISFTLPPLQGNSLDEHFQKLGHFASEPYLSMCQNKFTHIVAKPREWIRKPGWHRYEPGKLPQPVPYPLEDTIVFDVETLYKISPYPVLATALSSKAWYSWCSPYLCGDDNPQHLIPMNSTAQKRLVIGHNVGYDRARVLEEYNLQESETFFLDTMSLHIASSGMCSRQRPKWMKNKKTTQKEQDDLEPNTAEEEDPWMTVSTMNSLKDVALLHCHIKMNKEPRDFFATLNKNEIIDNFQEMVNYCSTDVEVTSKVFDKVFPLFREKCPHPVSFGALKILSSCILPTQNKGWQQYISQAESIYQESKQKIEDKIIKIVEETVKMKDTPEMFSKDPWLRQLDWTIKPLRLTKKGVPVKGQKLPGFPEWYRSLFPNRNSEKPSVTIRSRVVPLFFKLSWDGSPVIWTESSGWCFQVPKEQIEDFKRRNYAVANEEEQPLADEEHVLLKVPHPNGPEFNCTTLLSKPYINFFEKGILTSHSEFAHDALKINSSGSYWMSARERIMSQFVVKKQDFPGQFKQLDSTDSENPDLGIILPTVIPMGTVTRRSVENTWLTASNAKENRIGSELKTQVQAPNGYSFVGADVDSEELWIASLVGDSVFNIHGGTAIGWMCLEGTKNEGTDLHTKTAKILGCSRNEAKIFNYGRIYGAGVKFATQLLKRFNPALSDEEAVETAGKLYESTKGKTKRSKVFKKFWYGGSESVLFNKLEHIAEQDEPKTPVLGAGITFSLMRRNLGSNSFLPSRINWAIQSSGVDYLHLLCCSMNYLIKKYSIKARLSLSIHDEIRFLVAETDKYRAAKALQISNIWTRAIFCEQMGIDDLPQNCAFFSAVDIDHVMRKEVDMDCITPSNSIPIPHGESVDIRAILENPKSHLGTPNNQINVSDFPYNYREPVFSNYNKAYTKEFLKYFLKMQVQTAKWKIDELEDAYFQEMAAKKFYKDTSAKEYSFLDYVKDIKSGKREKISIMQTSYAEDKGTTVQKYRKADGQHEPVFKKDVNTEHERQSSVDLLPSCPPNDLELQHRLAAEAHVEDPVPVFTRKPSKKVKPLSPMERRYKRVHGGRKAFEAFNQCIDKSREIAEEKEKQFFKNTVDPSKLVDSIIDDVLAEEEVKPVNKTKPRIKAKTTKKSFTGFKQAVSKEKREDGSHVPPSRTPDRKISQRLH